MLLSCVVFLKLMFCLRKEECMKGDPGSAGMKSTMKNWNLDESFVVAVIVILVVSMGSSSMVEEEQYIWHFVTSTLFWILFRKSIQFLPLGEQGRVSRSPYRSRYAEVSLILIIILGRIIRGWHQGGVNWTHLPDIAKWLEEAGSRWIKAFKVLSGILITSSSLFAFSTVRLNGYLSFLVKFLFLLSGYLVLRHIMKYEDEMLLASGHGATFTAQIIYAVLGISTCFTVLAAPWLSPLYTCGESSSNSQSSGSQSVKNNKIHVLGGLKESSYLTGWAYVFSWSLLHLLLQQPVNSMPVLLLLLQISAAMICFSNGVGRKPWVEVAALYFMGMVGHFGLGNSNTLATVDVAGAFIGISSHSTVLSGILMFCITYASPMLVLLSLVMYISFKDESYSRVEHSMDFGLLLKSVLAIPLLVPLCINSVLLIAYTVVLLLMRDHLFIWSVFSPKYLYVCATTVCVYVGVCIVAATEIYTSLVCTFRSRKSCLSNGTERAAVG